MKSLRTRIIAITIVVCAAGFTGGWLLPQPSPAQAATQEKLPSTASCYDRYDATESSLYALARAHPANGEAWQLVYFDVLRARDLAVSGDATVCSPDALRTLDRIDAMLTSGPLIGTELVKRLKAETERLEKVRP